MEKKHGFFKKFLIAIALILFILFCASQKQAHALVIKQSIPVTYKNGFDRTTELINTLPGTSTAVEFELSTPLDTNYSLIGFNMVRFGIHGTWGSDSSSYACTFSYLNGQLNSFSCPNQNYYERAIASYAGEGEYYHVYGFVRYVDGTTGTCYRSTEYENYIMCPTSDSPIKTFVFRLNTALANNYFTGVYYSVTMNDEVLGFNYESTEIINSNGVIIQQNQQTQDIMTGTDTTGASTKGTDDINSNASSLNSQLDSTVGTADFVSLFTTFFSQIDNSSCTPISLPIPYTNENLVLPCLGTEFQNRIPLLWTLYVTIITGVVVLRFWRFYIDMFKHLLDPYSTGLHGVSDIAGGGK